MDTIIFRLHDLSKCRQIINLIYTSDDVVGYSEAKYKKDEVTMQFVKNYNHGSFLLRKTFEKVAFAKLRSSHYTVACRVDRLKDYVEFNLSIPKFLYGHNILQFLPDIKSANLGNISASFNEQYLKSYDMLHNFLALFFSKYLFTPDVPWERIELIALDLCYNQHFDTKQDALDYIHQQMAIRKSKVRYGSNFSRDWNTTIAFKSYGRFFKIYHKGSEYAANDRNEHAKINDKALRAGRSPVFDIDYLQEYADKLLRYEIRYFFKYQSYLFRNKIFRKGCPIHAMHKAEWNKLHALSRKPFHELVDPTNPEGKLQDRLQPYQRKFYRHFQKMLQLTDKVYFKADRSDDLKAAESDKAQAYYRKSPYYWIKSDSMIKSVLEDRRFTGRYVCTPEKLHYQRIRFSYPLFELMVNDFWSFFKEFQLKSKPTFTDYSKRIDAYIEEVKRDNRLRVKGGYRPKRVPNKSRLLPVLSVINTNTFEEIEQKGYWKRSTWYKLKSELKKMGIDKASLMRNSINYSSDFQAYYQNMYLNYKKLFLNKK